MSRLLAALGAAFVLFAAPASATVPSTWTVTRTDDAGGSCVLGGSCSLRQAMNAATTGDIINLPASATPYSVTAVLTTTKNLTIAGAGARTTTISGGGTTQVFDLGPSPSSPTITIKGLTITGGKITGSNGFGAGLLLENGTYTLSDVAIVGNTITVSGNAIGAGLATSSATVTLNRVLIAGNTATGNAASFGGGIGNGAALTVNDSTITGNTAASPGSAYGGGVSTGAGTAAKVTFTGSTIAGNTAKQGGNVYSNISAGGYVRFARSIISGGTGTLAGANCQTAAGSFTTLGGNVESLNQCGLAVGEKHDTNPLLGSLGDHGGPTDTLAFTGASPALHLATGCTGFDQRGLTRPDACTAGALEPQAPDVQVGAEATTAQAGTPYTLGAYVSDADGDAGQPAWTFDDGGTAQGSSVQHTFTTAGDHTFTVSVTDTTGLSTSAQGTVTVAAAPGPGGTGGDQQPPPGDGPGPGASNGDLVAPVISAVKLLSGHRVRFTLSEEASVALRIRHCTRLRHGHCTRWSKGTTVTPRYLKAGPRTWKLPTKGLRPGRYRAELVATDGGANRSKTARATFRISQPK